jgi:hypothetical protein
MRILSGILLVLAISLPACSQETKSCGGFEGLVGVWVGTGGGAPGQSEGGFTFKHDLQDKIMLRRSFAVYPATKDSPGSRHDDLMVLYDAGAKHRADYWDNEGHTIHYAVVLSSDGCTATFESERSAGEPAFRLTYTFTSPDEVNIGFQIAPPGKDFADYITATAKRKK